MDHAMNNYLNLQPKKQIQLFGFLAIISMLLIGCASEKLVSEEREDYNFNSVTILDSLSQDIVSFNKIFERGMPELSGSLDVKWRVEDFFTVSQAIHTFVWGESLEEWKLNDVAFNFTCDLLGGSPYPYKSFLRYFRNEGDARYVSEINIRSTDNRTWIEKTEYQPRIREWSIIERDRIISVDDILNLADNRWGEEIRNEANNSCEVVISYSDNDTLQLGFPYWRIIYETYQEDGEVKESLSFYLNALTGEEFAPR